MRLLPVRGPPADEDGTRRECPVCLEEITANVEWVRSAVYISRFVHERYCPVIHILILNRLLCIHCGCEGVVL